MTWLKFAAVLLLILGMTTLVSLPMFYHGEPFWLVFTINSGLAGLILYAFRKTVMEALDP